MKKILAICGALMLLGVCSTLRADNFFTTLKPGSINGTFLYSTRYKTFAGSLEIKTEKDFCNGWVKGMTGFIPEIGVDKDKEWFAGASVNLLKKWQEKADCPGIIKDGFLSTGISFGFVPKEKFMDSQGDILWNIISAGWAFK